MAVITYTTNLNLAKPYKGMLDWDDENNGNFDTIDTYINANIQNTKQIANDIYQVPEATALASDASGTTTINVGAGNTGDFVSGDTVKIWDDNTAAAQFVVDSKNDGTGDIVMTTTVPATYTTSQGAKIQRVNGRLDGDGAGNLSENLVDRTLFASILAPSVTGQNKVLTVGASSAVKSDGSKVYAFVDAEPGNNINYNGGTVDFGNGTITGGGDSFTPPNIGSDYITALVSLTPVGNLTVDFGLQASVYADSRNDTNKARGSSSNIAIARVTLRGDGGGSYLSIRREDIEDCRPFLNLGGGGAGTGSGGSDLLSEAYYARHFDDFESDTDITDATKTTGTFNQTDKKYTLSYDASKTLTVSGNSVTIPSDASYTVAVGDVIQTIGATGHTRVSVVTNQQSFTVDDGSVLTTGQPGIISQVFSPTELTNYGSATDKTRLIDQISDVVDSWASYQIDEAMVGYSDSAIPAPGTAPDIAYAICSNSTLATAANWSNVSTRPEGVLGTAYEVVIPNPGNLMNMRFFANKSSGTGTVDLVEFAVRYIPYAEVDSHPLAEFAAKYSLASSTWSIDGTNTPSISTVGGKTRVSLGFSVDIVRAANRAKSQLFLFINGQEIYKNYGSIISGDYNYTFLNNTTIEFNTDLTASATDDIELVGYLMDAGSVDVQALTNRFTTDGVYLDDNQGAHIRINTTTNQIEGRTSSSAEYGPLGGSGGQGGDVLQNAELGLPYEDNQNKLLDTFNTDLGTKSGVQVMTSSLIMSPDSLVAGTYVRDRATSAQIGSVEGKIVADIQALKPQAATISDASPSIKFDGDITDLLVNPSITMYVCIGKVTDSDGRKVLQSVITSSNKIAKFQVNTASYSSVNDETTVTLLNPDLLDLDMGMSANDVAAKLRFFPFAWGIQAASDDSSTWQDLDFENATLFDNGDVGLAGEGFFAENNSPLTGACLKQDVKHSPNKTFALKRMLEDRSGTQYIVLQYSIDRGVTWNDFASGGEISVGLSSLTNELGGSLYFNRNQIKVADNGKFFVALPIHGGTYWQIHGRYGDLSVGTPTLSLPNGASLIRSSGQNVLCMGIGIDDTDCSYIAVAATFASNGAVILSYNNSGANFLGETATVIDHVFVLPIPIAVTGSGTSHRAFYMSRNTVAGDIKAHYTDESSPTGLTTVGSGSGSGAHIVDYKKTDSYLICVQRIISDDTIRLCYITFTGPTFTNSTERIGYGGSTDLYNGWSSTGGEMFLRTIDNTIVSDPADEKHMFFAFQRHDTNGVRKGLVVEVADFTSIVASLAAQFTKNASTGLHNVSTREKLAHTFTLSGTSKIETVKCSMYKVGNTVGRNLTARIYNASAGLPTTAVSGAVSQAVDCSTLTVGNYEFVYFNFPRSISYAAGDYAVVFEEDYGLDASNYTAFGYNSGGSGMAQYNGSTWSSFSGALFVEINTHRIMDLGNSYDATAGYFGASMHNFEGTLELKNNTVMQYIVRRVLGASTSYQPISGHIFRRLININSGSECTYTDLTPVSKSALFDEELVFNVSCGNPDNYELNLDTGAVGVRPYYQRVGYPAEIFSDNVSTASLADSDFESGYCTDMQSSSRIAYGQSGINTSLWALGDRDFAIEAEIKKGTAWSGFHFILSNYTTSGFEFLVNSSGKVQFWANSSDYSETNETVPLTYCKLRVTKVNGIVKIWKSDPLVSGGSWVEFTYASTAANNKSITSTAGGYYTIGSYPASLGANPLLGRVGYVKMKISHVNTLSHTDPFTYEGYRDQSSIITAQNEGHMIYGRELTGKTNDVIAENFNKAVQSSGQESALVDSYTQLLKFKKPSLTPKGQNCKLKITMNRASTRDISKIKGIEFDYNK